MRSSRSPSSLTAVDVLSPGFHAELERASLWDLVQIECLGRRRRLIHVTTAGDVGQLFLAEGRIVHATTRRLAGTAAACHVLSWSSGSFQSEEHDGAVEVSIHTPLAVLMLDAARLRDDAGGGDDSGGMRFGAPGDRDDETRPRGPLMAAGLPDLRAAALLGADAGDFPVAVRIDAAANVLEWRGHADGLVSVSSYVGRLADVVGATLGIGDLVALHGAGADEEIVLGRGPGGEVLALSGRARTAPAALFRRIGL